MKKIVQIIAYVTLFFQYGNASSPSSILGQSKAEFTLITIVAENRPFLVFRRDSELTAPDLNLKGNKWYEIQPISQELPHVYRMQTTFDPWDKSVYSIGIIKNGALLPYVKPRYGNDFHRKSTWIINGLYDDTIE